MATKNIRDRLYALLDTITPASGVLTIAPRIPRGAQDYEGYIVLIDMVSGTGQRIADRIRSESLQWRIRLYSPALGIGFDSVREDAMYDLRDQIIDKLEDNQSLEHPTTRIGLNGVQGTQIASERFTVPAVFGDVDRALWECTLTVLTERVTC
jgi:hypothetical protein